MTSDQQNCIRPIEPSSPHIVTIARWLNEEWGITQGYSLPDTEDWCRDLVESEDETIIIATTTTKDVLIGVVIITACDLEGEEHLTPWLSSLYVPRDRRGSGIGGALITASCGWAHSRGLPTLYLYAKKGVLTSYYAGLGWIRCRDIKLDNEMFQIMRKSLTLDGASSV